MPLTRTQSDAHLLDLSDGRMEIIGGQPREKPEMSWGHNEAVWGLMEQLRAALPKEQFRVRQNAGHLRLPNGDSYVPDLIVVPVSAAEQFRNDPRKFESHSVPLPFVVEVWSPSTGTYDIDQKIPGYRVRGDLEIWRIHPFERHVRVWRRNPDGGYAESTLRGGRVRLHALPDVTIELDPLFVT